MHLWPTYTSQNFYIPKALDSEDVDILDIISIQSINTFLVLTKERVLVYQGKPFAPCLIYTRSKESLKQFGYNEKITFNEPLKKIAGVNDADVAVIDLNLSSIFYIKTDTSCLLIFELETLKNWSRNLTTYGIAPILETENISNKIEFIEKVDLAANNQYKNSANSNSNSKGMKRDSIFYMEIDKNSKDNIDDDLLTVFDIKTNGRILQNGFINEKGKDLVQIMKEMFFIKSSFYRTKKNVRKKLMNNNIIDNSNDEANQEDANNVVEDMPFKKCNIKLKTVLKFDNNIMDVQVFTKYSESNERQEIIYLLYENELCILTLKSDYTLEAKHKISGGNNQMMAFNGTDMFVINYDESGDAIVVNRIDKRNNVIYTKDLIIPEFKKKKYKLIGINNFKERYLVLTFDKMILYYDTFLNTIYSQIKLLKTTGILSELQRDQYINVKTYDRELLTLLKENGYFQVYTRWGNLQTEINLSRLLSGKSAHDYTSFAFLGNYLVCATKTGHLQVVDFYKKFKSNIFNERGNADCSLFDSTTNKITTFFDSQVKESYFLPTNSINNIVSDIKYNGSKKYCFINIPNKNIVLLKDFNTIEDDIDYDGWMVFDNMKVMGMEWIGDRYVLLDMIDLDNIHNGRSIVCLDINKIIKSKSYKSRVVHLLEMKIWAYNITNNDEILYWGCNTFDNMIEFAKKKSADEDAQEILHKLGELNILLKDVKGSIRIETIDILVNFDTLNVRSFARNILDLSKLTDVLISYEKDVKWMCHKKKGTLLILTGDDELHKVVETENGSVTYEIVFTKVEEIIDLQNGSVTFVRENEFLIYNFNELIENQIDKAKQVILQQPLINFGNQYPLMIKPELDDFISISTEYTKYDDVINGFKLKENTVVILDYLLKGLAKSEKYSVSEVKTMYSKSEHYKFCLEKMITDILVDKLDKDSDETSFKLALLNEEALEDKLNIVVNSLRKVDLDQVVLMLNLLKYESLDSLIKEVERLENMHTKAMLISKLMVVKFNMEGKVDDELLETGVKLIVEDIENSKCNDQIEQDFTVIKEIGMFVQKLNGNKDVMVKLIESIF